MNIVDVIILGLVQGVTEFLPISSTGHLVLIHNWLEIEGVNSLAFDAVLHFATTLAIIIYFRADLFSVIQVAFRKLSRLPVNDRDINLLYALMIGTIPAVILGLLLDSYVSEHLRTTTVVAMVLFCTAIFFMYTEWRYYLRSNHYELTVKKGWQVGLFQMMALLPGISRSGVTIAGGMLLGMTRYEASRFSFLLAIPITLGVGIKKMIELLGETAYNVDWALVGIGSTIAFFTALIVIHYFLHFIRKYTLWPFVWYSIILSGMIWYVELVV